MTKYEAYACYNLDETIRHRSSSGAMLFAVANYIFSKDGIVYGVTMTDDCYSAKFVSATCNEELFKICGSKYLQAKIGEAYKNVKANLQEGKIVLFTGTACQINGLKKYLGRDYDMLYCIDVICHGVPSPALWKEYVMFQEKKYNAKLKNVNFRYKGIGINNFDINNNQVFIPKNEDSYMKMFLRDYCLRPACYECIAKKQKKSDITMGDFWGIENVAPDMNDGKGISLVIIRTDKGKHLFEMIKNELKIREVLYDEGVMHNPAEYDSVKKPIQRNNFFRDMKEMSFAELEVKYTVAMKLPLKRRIKQCIRSIICKKSVTEKNNESVLLTFEEKIDELV